MQYCGFHAKELTPLGCDGGRAVSLQRHLILSEGGKCELKLCAARSAKPEPIEA
jgi:hypothetical protein